MHCTPVASQGIAKSGIKYTRVNMCDLREQVQQHVVTRDEMEDTMTRDGRHARDGGFVGISIQHQLRCDG